MRSGLRRGVFYGGLGVVGAALAYLKWLRPWQQHWGATEGELAATMPGDALVPHPMEVTTRAVTVDARPEHIWPWLVQMGFRRGGLYSYDWIDRVIGALDQASSRQVLPQFQRLEKGDLVPYAMGTDMRVEEIEPGRFLVLSFRAADADVTQAFGLYPIDQGHTRLVLRVRARLQLSVSMVPTIAVIEPAEFFMVRKQLLGIKERAEALARQDQAARAEGFVPADLAVAPGTGEG